ncbi:MAG: protein kinase [Deltaproteobacteria bacterium]|nr:protein kinase [Deltaproteobacteria bacterium]
MSALPSGCPDENVLLRVALGTSADAELALVEAHLDTCDRCRRTLVAAASEVASPPPRAAASLQHGEQVGRYVVEEILGVGGMGVVYAARDPSLDRRVAIKVMRNPEHEPSGARLRREAQAMAKLAHANVVPVFELGEWNGKLFLAMELVEGQTLEIWRRGKPSPELLVQAFIDAGRGLAAAHAAGVVHRDFKPANVLLGKDGRARVTDFGLARPDGAPLEPRAFSEPMPVELTRTGAMLGTLAYMAPEQLEGKPADARSDQFAWCIGLAEALTGKRPFDGTDAASLHASIARGPRLDGVPTAIRRVLARGLSIDPASRFPSMDALLDALEATQRRRIARWVAGGAIALLGVVMAAVLVSAQKPVASLDAPAVVDASAMRAEPMPADGTIRVTAGVVKRLWIPGLARVAVGDSEISDVSVAGENVLEIVGKRAGHTSVVATSGTETKRWELEVAPAGPTRSTLKLRVGNQEVIDTVGTEKLAIGDPDIADIKPIGERQVLVVGMKAGSTELTIWEVGGGRRQVAIDVAGP